MYKNKCVYSNHYDPDPYIGFGKKTAHNFSGLPEIRAFTYNPLPTKLKKWQTEKVASSTFFVGLLILNISTSSKDTLQHIWPSQLFINDWMTENLYMVMTIYPDKCCCNFYKWLNDWELIYGHGNIQITENLYMVMTDPENEKRWLSQ